jgi:hypothetical protein
MRVLQFERQITLRVPANGCSWALALSRVVSGCGPWSINCRRFGGGASRIALWGRCPMAVGFGARSAERQCASSCGSRRWVTTMFFGLRRQRLTDKRGLVARAPWSAAARPRPRAHVDGQDRAGLQSRRTWPRSALSTSAGWSRVAIQLWNTTRRRLRRPTLLCMSLPASRNPTQKRGKQLALLAGAALLIASAAEATWRLWNRDPIYDDEKAFADRLRSMPAEVSVPEDVMLPTASGGSPLPAKDLVLIVSKRQIRFPISDFTLDVPEDASHGVEAKYKNGPNDDTADLRPYRPRRQRRLQRKGAGRERCPRLQRNGRGTRRRVRNSTSASESCRA